MEVNFDCLVGSTHHYAGLAFGNLASMHNSQSISNPKQAALQGLEKMALCMRLGIPQAVLPPQSRPNIELLRNVGFHGTDIEVLQQANKQAPMLFSAAFSASSMWAANAATVSPSADTQDGKVHLTVANLISNIHRAQEAKTTYKVLKKIFANPNYFHIHPPLLSTEALADEGAANHNRFANVYTEPGVELFVYGKEVFCNPEKDLIKFPARQSLEASQAIARLHHLDPQRVLFVKQNPAVIDAGVFHNDVVAVSNQNVFLYHELAYENTEQVISYLKKSFPENFYFLKVPNTALSIAEAVNTYLFNSQILTLSNGSMAIIAPQECQESKQGHEILLNIVDADNPIQHLDFINCRESMKNGGGPACLRLRVVLTEEEKKMSHMPVYLSESLYHTLVQWVHKYYRDKLEIKDLLDPLLIQESREALEALTQILQLGSSIYEFQYDTSKDE